MTWQVQKVCADVGNYELIVEKQKRTWECEQKREYWKWNVVYHGTIVSSGVLHDIEEAKKAAQANVPTDHQKTDTNCGCDVKE